MNEYPLSQLPDPILPPKFNFTKPYVAPMSKIFPQSSFFAFLSSLFGLPSPWEENCPQFWPRWSPLRRSSSSCRQRRLHSSRAAPSTRAVTSGFRRDPSLVPRPTSGVLCLLAGSCFRDGTLAVWPPGRSAAVSVRRLVVGVATGPAAGQASQLILDPPCLPRQRAGHGQLPAPRCNCATSPTPRSALAGVGRALRSGVRPAVVMGLLTSRLDGLGA